MSCPGPVFNVLTSQNVLNNLKGKHVEKVAIMRGTKNSSRAGWLRWNLFEVQEKLKRLVTLYKIEFFLKIKLKQLESLE